MQIVLEVSGHHYSQYDHVTHTEQHILQAIMKIYIF